MSQFEAVYGRPPPTLLYFGLSPSLLDEVDQLLCDQDAHLDLLRQHLDHAKANMKAQTDKHRRSVEYEVGEQVYLKLRPYRLQSLAKQPFEKLSSCYFGPYLTLLEDMHIHPVFHVSHLKCFAPSNVRPQPLPPLLTEERTWHVVPSKITTFSPSALEDKLLTIGGSIDRIRQRVYARRKPRAGPIMHAPSQPT
ncbi:uncharacterized protein LOC144712671 [Wolffia australiana]